jgi:hypothetical protein
VIAAGLVATGHGRRSRRNCHDESGLGRDNSGEYFFPGYKHEVFLQCQNKRSGESKKSFGLSFVCK